MTARDKVHKVVIADPELDLASCRRLVARTAEEMRFSTQERDDIVSAVFEACVNAVTYGRTPITVELVRCDDRLEAVIRDSGDGFMLPAEIKMPDPSASSGRGLATMSALMDEVEVTSDDGHALVLVKYLREQADSK